MGRVLKFIIGLALLPLVWATCKFSLGILLLAMNAPAWQWGNVAWFGAGFVIWLVCFHVLPRPTWLYVFGHELTHVVAIWLSGGIIFRFIVTTAGGQVHTDRTSMFISLAPYIIPLFPAVTGLAWVGMTWMWPDLVHYQHWFLFYWGLVWSFHLSFTIAVFATEQTDFSSQGYLFSYVIILLGNLWIITGLLWAWTEVYGLREGLNNYLTYCWNDYDAFIQFSIHAIRHLFMLFNRPVT